MIFVLSLFCTPLLLIRGASTAIPNLKLQLQELNFDQTTTSSFLNQSHLIIATQTKSQTQKYQVEMKMIDLRNNSIVKSTLVGNQTDNNYRPHILIVQQSLYISFISQQGYELKLKVAILDIEFNVRGDPILIGTPIDYAKSDYSFKYIYLLLLDKNTIAILWCSTSLRQWNYREINLMDNTITNITVLPESDQVSVAKNPQGVRVFAQVKSDYLYLSKLTQMGPLITKIIIYNRLGFVRIFLTPDNKFILASWYEIQLIVKQFNEQFVPIGDPIYNEFDSNNSPQQMYMINYDLIFMSSSKRKLIIKQIDVRDFIINKNGAQLQERSVIVKDSVDSSQEISFDILSENLIYLKWLYRCNSQQCWSLVLSKLDMNIIVNPLVSNCFKYAQLYQCQQCVDGYILNEIDQKCIVICPENCLNCSDPSYCDQCKIGYYYNLDNLCVIQNIEPIDLRISDEQIRKGKPKLLIIENEVILIYGLYAEINSYLKIKKLTSIGQIKMETNLIRDFLQLRDYDLTFGDDDQKFRLLVRWFENGFDKIIEYIMNLQDLSLVEQNIFMEKMVPDIEGDQILIQRINTFGLQKIYYFYLVKFSSDQFQLCYNIKSQILQNSVNLRNFSNDGLQLHSVIYQNTIFLQIQSNEDLLVFSSFDDDKFLVIQNYQFHQVELMLSTSLFFDQSNFFQIALDQKNNFQLFLNVTKVPQRIQITQTSRNPKLGSVEIAGISHIFVAWLGISNMEPPDQIEQVYIKRISLKTYQVENFEKVICSSNCLDCNDEGKCLQCQNEQYQLINGACILICSNNCDKCEIENQCLVCQSSYYLNSNLQCIQNEFNYISSIDNVKEMNSFYTNQNLITVYLKQNSTRLEVILEEFENQLSLSGEIRISSNDDYMIVLNKPKVIKKGFYYFVTYLTQLQTGQYQRVLVILNDAYQQCSRNLLPYTQTVESDIFISEKFNIYSFSIFLNGKVQSLRLSFFQFENCYISEQKWWQGDNEFNDGNNFQKVRFANNYRQNTVPLLFTTRQDGIEIDHLASFDETLQVLSRSVRHSYQGYQQNGWTIRYDVIEGKQIELQFYNENEILQQEYLIGSINTIFSFNLQINNNYVYLAYLEQDASTYSTTINLNQYTLNGIYQKQIQINTNEKYIRDLCMAINDQFVQLSWTSNYFNKSYRTLLNQELQQIPLNSQQCENNCKKCDENKQCLICLPGFTLEQSICKPICSDSCQQCSIPYTCDYCQGNLKYIDNKCQDITKLKLEQSICSESCYGVAQTLQFDSNNVIVTYQEYNQTYYSIKVKSYKVDNSSFPSITSLITQTQIIYYHKIFKYTTGKFLLVWLSGNCPIQCRLMIQLFNQDLSQKNNQKEIKVLTTDISIFNLQIDNYHQSDSFPFYLVWCEFDHNKIPQIIVGSFSLYYVISQSIINQIVEQTFNDIPAMPYVLATKIFQYYVCYLANNDTIKLMIENTIANTVSYKELYKTANKIISLSVAKQSYFQRIVVAWIEIVEDQWSAMQYQLKIQQYDEEMKAYGGQEIFPTNNKQISSIIVTIDYNGNFTLNYIEMGQDQQFRVKAYISNNHQVWFSDSEFANKTSQQVNILSNYEPNTLFNAYQSDFSKHFITFEGELNNQKQIFIRELRSASNFLSQCPINCFYCNYNNQCQLCVEGFEMQQNLCVQKLPDFCDVGQLGECIQCSDGYSVTISGLCSLSDPYYQAIKLNTYSLLNKQRLSTFQNGNIIVVWYRLYYQTEGTGIYMSLYNVHGDRLIDETRINLIPEGIQIFPDVQVLQNDQVICVWFDGDLEIGAQIKMQRFTNQLIRIDNEIIVKDNIKLNKAINYDTPLIIQQITNGFVIVWMESISQNDYLFINFYDNEANFQKQWKLNNDDQIRNYEPVVTSNQQIIVVLWCSQTSISNTQIRLSSFSLNNVFIDSQILSENGQAPSADVLVNENFVFAWMETYIGQDEIMSKKIVYRIYSPDLTQQYYSHFLGEASFNQNNPDLIHTNQGFAIIFENTYQNNSDVRNLKIQYFDLNGQTASPLITVTNQQGLYPHHPQLTQLPQGQFIASYIQSPILQYSLDNDVYMKRYDSNGDQLLLSTIACSSNCKICQTSQQCMECKLGYRLFNSQCQKSIQNCKTYSSDLGLCIECNQNYILVSTICKLSNKQLDFSIEIATNITSSPRSVVFSDGVIGQFWYSNYTIWFQKFNQSGYNLTNPYNITRVNSLNKFVFFDVLVVDEKNYLLALLDYGTIYVKIFNSSVNAFQSNSMYQYTTQGILQEFINWNTNNIVVQLLQIDVLTVGLFFLNKNSNIISLKMQLLIRQSGSNIQYQSASTNPIQLVSQAELDYLTTDNIDVQIQGGYISILKPVPKSNIIAYLYQIYDQQGHILSTLRIPINNKRIDYTLLQISTALFIEAWTQLESLCYEVYYQLKQFDGIQIADPVKISNSKERYKFDVKLVNLKKITILSWREGQSAIDIVSNTKFKAAIISQKTGLANVIDLNYSPQNSTLEIVQLPNQDIVFSFIVVDEILNSTIKSVKFSPQGEQLIFSAPRCNYGCQQCNQQLTCLKCFDSYNYNLTTQGTCIDQKSDCLNYDSNCWDCLTGYYMSIYRTCEAITQIMEMQLSEEGYQLYPSKIAYYPDGKFIIVYVKETYLEAIVYSSNGQILLQPFTIHTIGQGFQGQLIKDAAILVYPDQTVSLLIVYSLDIINVGCQYTHVLISSTFVMIGEENILYGDSELAYSDHMEILVKQLTFYSVGFMIKTRRFVYLVIHTNQFHSVISNIVLYFTNFSSQNVDIDFVQTSNNIIIVYTTNSENSIINIYDLNLIFIKNITINDGKLIKAAVNRQDQVVIVTKSQISFIEQNILIREMRQDKDLYPMAIQINSEDQIQVLSYTSQISYPLIIFFFNNQGTLFYERQVNMNSKITQVKTMNLLYNNQINIFYEGRISYQSGKSFYIARFDQFGNSKNISEIICPKNCDICTQSNQCQQCSNGYYRDEQTLLCNKICTVTGCKSCEISLCDKCQDQMQLLQGQCISFNTDPMAYEFQIGDECSDPIKQKIIKFSNTDYALVFYCQKQITIKRYTKENIQVLSNTNIFDGLLFDYDVTVVQDVVYILVVVIGQQNEAQIFKFNQAWTQVSVITYPSQIIQISIIGLPSHYSIFLSGNKPQTLDNIKMSCQVTSFYSYDTNDVKTYEQLQFNPPSNIYDCNRNTIKSVTSFGQWIHVISNEQNGVKIATFSNFGQIAFTILQIPQSDEIYLQTDSVQFFIISKIRNTKTWKMYILDKAFKITFTNDNFIEGDYIFSLAITDVSIMIAYNKIGQESVVQYQIIDKLGTMVKQGYVTNRAISKNPILFRLNQNSFGFSWSGIKLSLKFGLSFAFLDMTGKFVQSIIICSDNCDICLSPIWCIKCKGGYIFVKNLQQQSQFCELFIALPHCVQYQDEGKCIQCEESYNLELDRCVFDLSEKNTIIVNQATEFNQIQPNGITFKDGSLLVVWSSMSQNGDSWGVYAQLHNSQGQKIGDNIRINENTIGPQHSPRLALLNDDTVLIIYIDGNPQEGAKIKGIRYTNQLIKTGTEKDFSTFIYQESYLKLNYLINIESLSNGGFVLGYIENTINNYDQIVLLFYDQNYNQVIRKTHYCYYPTYGNDIFTFASTQSTMVVYYVNLNQNYQASTYTLDGQLQNTLPMNDINYLLINKLRGTNQYYGLIKRVITSDQCQLQFQLYTNQFTSYGNQIIIDTISIISNQYPYQIQMSTFNSGFLIAIQIVGEYQKQVQQYFVNLDWEVIKLKTLNYNQPDSDSFSMSFTYVGTILTHFYIINQQFSSSSNFNSDQSNIALLRFTRLGAQQSIDDIVCSNNCVYCDSSNTCSTCIENYLLNQSICQPICEENCLACLNPSSCNQCSTGYYQKIEGKCSPIQNDYIQPEVLLNISQRDNILGLDQISTNEFVIFTQQNMEQFTLYLYQDSVKSKQITVQVTQIINYQNIYPFYIDDNLVLVVYYSDRIIVKRFNAQSQTLLDSQIVMPSLVKSYSDIIVEPIENNQYSINYCKKQDNNLYVYHAVLEKQLNFIVDFQLILTQQNGVLEQKTKTTMNTVDYLITRDQVKQSHYIYSARLSQFSRDVVQLSNRNYVQIFQSWKDINSQSQSNFALYYVISDIDYKPLTQEAKVIGNNYLSEKIINIFTFDDSFTILVEQISFYNQNNALLVAQRFENSGAKIGSYSYIDQHDSSLFRAAIKQQSNYLMIWLHVNILIGNKNILAKIYDKNGQELLINCISNCAQCKNSQQCQICKQNYSLDENNQCKLICPNNCNTCVIYNQCQTCNQGYEIINGKCNKQCFSNCGICSIEGTCTQCLENYQFNGDNSQCLPVCPSNCNSCTTPLSCDNCSNGYQKIKQQCYQLIPHCISYSGEGKCIQCEEFYILELEKCVLDFTDKNTIIVNQATEFNQIQPNGITFKDGSLLVVWSSMNQDGDSWGVYAQLHNSQGQKIGDNIRINENTIGPQHSPRLALLNDDTVLIIYIDGNLVDGAIIKGIRYNNQLIQIDKEYIIGDFTFIIEYSYFDYIVNIQALSNGGFIVGYIENVPNDKIILLFYDSSFNLVQRVSNTFIFPERVNFFLQLASTSSTVAVYYINQNGRVQVFLYSVDGSLLNTVMLNYITSQYVTKISCSNQYYGIVQKVYKNNSYEVSFQLYTENFIAQGNSIIIDTIPYNQHSPQYIQIASYNSGFLIAIHFWGQSEYLQQYFVNLNQEVMRFKDLQFSFSSSYGFPMGFTFVRTQQQHYYIIWQKLNLNYFTSSDKFDIAIQKFSNQGPQLYINDTSCSNNCLKCDTINTCSICLENYNSDNFMCKPICELHCSECQSPLFCLKCSSGYFKKIDGKCDPFQSDYNQTEIFQSLNSSDYIRGIDQLNENKFVIFTSQGWLFQLLIFQNNQLLKLITVQIPQVLNVLNMHPFYVDEDFILVIYTDDKIIIKRYNTQTQILLDLQLMNPSSIQSQSNIVVEPIQNNQYSLVYTTRLDQNLYVYHATLDHGLNIQNDLRVILTSFNDYQWEKTKNALFTKKYKIFRDQITQFYVTQPKGESQVSQGIYQLQNNNKIEIIKRWDDINSQYYFMAQTLYYHILDSNYLPITNQAKIIANNYVEEFFINILIFDDSFTVLMYQSSQFNLNIKSQIIAQRFDNFGAKIGGFYYIDEVDYSNYKIAIQMRDQFIIFWQDTSYDINNLLAKKYHKNGTQLLMLTNCTQNCFQCKNLNYCEICNENYLLDVNYQCKLICPNNCNTCTIVNQCQTCIQGYKVIDGQCIQIQCITNCKVCQSEVTCAQCQENYKFNENNSLCLPVCTSDCTTCTTPFQCDICLNGYILTPSKTCFAVGPSPSVGTTVIQYFENGDYVVLWSQTGVDAGVYFQLYTKDGNKYGEPTKVGGTRRRLLNENIPQQFAADLVVNKQEFTILWIDATKQTTFVNIQQFDKTGTQVSEIIQLGTYPEINLSTIKLPCQIRNADNNIVVAFFSKKETSEHSLEVKTYDQQLQQKSTQQINDVNTQSAPKISYSDGIIYISYSSQGYLFIQKLTKDGNLIDQPEAIRDPNSLIIRTTTLKNGMIVFQWENKIESYTLNYQLISKDLKTRSEVMGIDVKNIAELSPDLKSFNEGFIQTWQIIGNEFRSPIIQFQIFNSLGGATTDIIDIIIDGLFPMNPNIQIINETIFAITCTGKKVNSYNEIQGDGIFIQQFDQHGKIIQDLPSNALCSYKCENCRSPLTCNKCSKGYQKNEQNQCIIDCGLYCESCSQPFICKQCKNGYNLTGTKECEEIKCLDGYIKNEKTQQCQPICPQYCGQCEEPNKCLICNNGYIISNGYCDLLIVDEDLNTREIILIVFVLILGAILVSFIVYGIHLIKNLKQIKLKLNQAEQIILGPALRSSRKSDDQESESQKKL